MLYREMKKQKIPVACIIDQNAGKISENVPACTLDDLQESLDIVIVTVVADIEAVRICCHRFNEDCYVFSLGDV